MKKGTIELKVILFLELDCTKKERAEIVQEMDYEFKHKLIADTEIRDYE